MPKKFTAVGEAIKDCPSPVMVFLSKGEVASHKTELKAFSDGNINLVSNVDKLFNPVAGGVLPVVEKSNQIVEGDTFKQFDGLVTMKCDECKVVAGVDPDLAFALAGEQLHCPSCGKETAFAYDESETADDDSDDTSDDSDDDTSDDEDSDEDTDDDSDDGDDDSDEVDDEEEIDDVDDSDSDDDSDDDSSDDEMSEDEDDTETAASKKAKGKTEKKAKKTKKVEKAAKQPEKAAEGDQPVVTDPAAAVIEEKVETVEKTEEQPATASAETTEKVEPVKTDAPVASAEELNQKVTEELHASSLVSEDAHVKLVTLTNDNSEIAVFAGQTHVGTIYRTKASEKAASLFEDGKKLVAAFKPVYAANRSNQKSSELAAYGYEPVVFKVDVAKIFEDKLSTAVQAEKASAEKTVETRIGDFGALIELAFVGINKGAFDSKNELANEIAALLRRSGVANAEGEARRVLANKSHNYVKAAIEKAKELAAKSPDYVKGLVDSISKAEFKADVASTQEKDISTISTSMLNGKKVPVETAAAATDIIGSVRKVPGRMEGNRYTGLVGRLGRR